MLKGGWCVTKTKASVAFLVALAAVLLVTSACGEGGKEEASPSPTGVATPATSPTPRFPFEGPVGIDLAIIGTFSEQGEPIQLIISVAVRDPMTLYYRTSQRYDLAVVNSQGQEVWRWSRNRAFAQVTEEVPLGVNETRSFSETWDQRGNDGQQVPLGNYRIVAESSHCGANYENCGQLTASATIQIRAPQAGP
ncbi:MAG: BsuPI-related putative proteinase inhibitor [Dehalococcoidia bacterium]|nr:BsuPI-related putative proteinase inhibitor [Dehalococcoidia bacterium]